MVILNVKLLPLMLPSEISAVPIWEQYCRTRLEPLWRKVRVLSMAPWGASMLRAHRPAAETGPPALPPIPWRPDPAAGAGSGSTMSNF